MIAALLLAQAAPAAGAPDDVVVLAEKLHRLRLATNFVDGRPAGCEVRVSSGDWRVDSAACAAMRSCADQGVTASEPLANCIDQQVATFVRHRADAVEGSGR